MADTTTQIRITIRVPADLVEAFGAVAREHERTISGELRVAMKERVECAETGLRLAERQAA